jgi:hypothetical protein
MNEQGRKMNCKVRALVESTVVVLRSHRYESISYHTTVGAHILPGSPPIAARRLRHGTGSKVAGETNGKEWVGREGWGPIYSTKAGISLAPSPVPLAPKKLAHVSRLGAQTLSERVGNFTHPPWTKGTLVFSPRHYTPLKAQVWFW